MNKAARKAKRLQTFYQNQNETIERWLRPVDDHVRLAEEFDEENKLKYKIAVQGSFAANVLLAPLQIYATVSSGSLSLFITMADAIFDPLSNVLPSHDGCILHTYRSFHHETLPWRSFDGVQYKVISSSFDHCGGCCIHH